MRISLLLLGLLCVLAQEALGSASFAKKDNDPEAIAEQKKLDKELDNVLRDLKVLMKERAEEKLQELEQNNKRDEILESAIKNIQEESVQRKEQRRTLDEPEKVRLIDKFLKGTTKSARVDLAARIQLKALAQYRETIWMKQKRENGATVSLNEFLRDAKQFFGDSVLKSRHLSKPLDTIITDYALDYDHCPVYAEDCSAFVDRFPFRSANGECNNLDHRKWGAADTAQARILEAVYPIGAIASGRDMMLKFISDEVDENKPDSTTPTGGFGDKSQNYSKDGSGDPLPSARTVSDWLFQNNLTEAEYPENPGNTYLVMTFGQFLDHDITSTPATDKDPETSATYCSGCEDTDPLKCFPIPTPFDADRECITFTRSDSYLLEDCAISEKLVSNSITAYIDLSNVYGSDDTTQADLRNSSDSRYMAVQDHPNKDASGNPRFGPILPSGEAGCNAREPSVSNPYSGYTQTCVSADNQIFSLETEDVVADDGFFTGYDETVSADILNEFSTAAMRQGHTEVKNFLTIVAKLTSNAKTKVTTTADLKDNFFDYTEFLYPSTGQDEDSGMDAILQGMMEANIGQWDQVFAESVRNNLFAIGADDLAARNVQRGREHGLDGYLKYREWCGLPEDFTADIRGKALKQLRALYKNDEDIDLYAGAMSEMNAEASFVGPTFACLLGYQFAKLKYGDRHYYEREGIFFNERVRGGSSRQELKTIKRQGTLASVMCRAMDNTAALESPGIPEKPFKTIDAATNPRTACSEIDDIDFNQFIDRFPTPSSFK